MRRPVSAALTDIFTHAIIIFDKLIAILRLFRRMAGKAE